MAQGLIGEIYEALFGPGDWTAFLSRLATVLPDGRAMLVHHDAAAGRGSLHLHVNVPDDWRDAYDAHFSRINPWMPIAARREIGIATNTSAMLSPRALGRTAFYGDLLRQIDFQEGVGITLERESGLAFALSVLGSDGDDGIVADAKAVLEVIAPHLRRAFTFYRGVTSGARGSGLSALESQVTLGVLRIGHRGVVQAANKAAERILSDQTGLFLDPAGRLATHERQVNDALQAWWSCWLVKTLPRMASWLIKRPPPRLPLRISLLEPARDAAQTFFTGPETFALIEDPDQKTGPLADVAAFYELTAAEARVLAEIVAGRSLRTIATDRRLSIETVRSQVKSLLAKTGSRNQADLVRLGADLGTIILR